jgi:type IV pilus assembly protein PilQ
MQDVLGKLAVAFVVFILVGCSTTPPEQRSGGTSSSTDSQDEDIDVNDDSSEEDFDLSEAGEDDVSDSDFESEMSSLDAEDDTFDTGVEAGVEVDEFADSEPDFEAEPGMAVQDEESRQAATTGSNVNGSGRPVEVVNLRYLANQGGGTIVIETSGEATYRSRFNRENNQFIVEVANARLPAKLKRPFNTKEFDGAIGSVDAYQNSGETTARFVVQLRGEVQPKVIQQGNTILVVPSGGGSLADSEPEVEGDYESAEGGTTTNDSMLIESDDFKTSLGNPTKYFGRPISIQLRDVDVRDVLTFLAEESGLNLVVSDAVSGKVTLKLRDIPWDHALLVILKTQKLGYVRQGNILRIAPLDKLKEETLEEAKILQSQMSLEPLLVRVLPVSYADVGELQAHVKEFLSARGKVIADKRSQSLIVTDIVESLERVGKLVTSLDTPPPQVLIEGKIIEAQDAFSKDIGVNWGLTGGDGISLGDGDLTASPGIRSSPSAAALGALGMLGTLTIGTFEGIGDLDASLALAEREEQIKILSSPRIVTINNEAGEIAQETEVPFITAIDTGGVITRSVGFKPAKVSLKVTPQITVDGGVMMLVEVDREFFGAVVDSETQSRRLNKRSAKTRVLVKNGQTAVLGGIYQSSMTVGTQGVPGLKDIPLIGGLFQAKSQQTEKNELLIFLTPRILNYKSAFVKGKGDKL